jgi:hypothetical protein
MRLDGSLEAAASLRVKLLDRLRGRSLFWQKKKPPRRAAAFKWFSREFGQLLTSSRIELCHLIGALGRDAAFEHHLDQQGDGDGNRALAAEPVADGAQAGYTGGENVRLPWEQNRRGLCRNGSNMRIWKSLPHTHSFSDMSVTDCRIPQHGRSGLWRWVKLMRRREFIALLGRRLCLS